MDPQIRRPGPGKCPLCGMDLIPVETSAAGPTPTLTLAPEALALMSLQTVPVARKAAETDIEMVGKVNYDETRLGHITAWVDGRIDRMFVDYTGLEVKKGDHMVYLYSEESVLRAGRVDQRAKICPGGWNGRTPPVAGRSGHGRSGPL